MEQPLQKNRVRFWNILMPFLSLSIHICSFRHPQLAISFSVVQWNLLVCTWWSQYPNELLSLTKSCLPSGCKMALSKFWANKFVIQKTITRPKLRISKNNPQVSTASAQRISKQVFPPLQSPVLFHVVQFLHKYISQLFQDKFKEKVHARLHQFLSHITGIDKKINEGRQVQKSHPSYPVHSQVSPTVLHPGKHA